MGFTRGRSISMEAPFHPLTQEEQRELVQRVLNSREFATSPSLRAFLLYVTDHAIAGKYDAIKEQQIGCQVLGRKPGYDPAEDNIVRVRARQVRQKLDSYFRDAGHHEPVVISIPKGHYVPVFRQRTVEPEDLDGGRAEGPAAAQAHADQKDTRATAVTWRLKPASLGQLLPWALAAAAVLAAGSFVSFGHTRAKHIPEFSPEVATARRAWALMLPNRNQQLTVITADAGFALWQDITHRELNLGAYLGRKYLETTSDTPEMREIAARRYTSPADVNVSLRLAEVAATFGSQTRVQFARSIDIHDVKNGNVVLLGSRRSNPWLELFEPSMNFVLSGQNGPEGPSLVNKFPKPGEPKSFSMPSRLEVHGAEGNSVDSYALAALMPNPSGHGMAFIVEGLSMEGTEAAGELITNLDRFGALLHQIGVKKGEPVKPFEMLLKLTAIPGGYGQSELCAYRYAEEGAK